MEEKNKTRQTLDWMKMATDEGEKCKSDEIGISDTCLSFSNIYRSHRPRNR